MNRLAAVLDVADVRVDVDVTSKPALFVEAAKICERHGWMVAPSTVTDALIAREQLGSTGLGHGVAIPHARLKGLKAAVASVIRSRKPLPFGAPDDEPVTLFVFLFVPQLATQIHLEILAEIAEMLSDKSVRDRLKHDADAEIVYATIAGWIPLGASRGPARRS